MIKFTNTFLLKQNRIKPQHELMANTMFKMFPIFQKSNNENLSEIPIPSKALSSRFQTIAESQPFGPVDAAKILELEPAAVTLEKLSTEGEHAMGHNKSIAGKKKNKVVYGELLKGERSQLKFVHRTVGKVGFRYGSGNRDNRKDRKIGYNKLGKMIYL